MFYSSFFGLRIFNVPIIKAIDTQRTYMPSAGVSAFFTKPLTWVRIFLSSINKLKSPLPTPLAQG